jgi:hypothetical protein
LREQVKILSQIEQCKQMKEKEEECITQTLAQGYVEYATALRGERDFAIDLCLIYKEELQQAKTRILQLEEEAAAAASPRIIHRYVIQPVQAATRSRVGPPVQASSTLSCGTPM